MKNITSIDVNDISTAELHQILLTSVAPRPIAFASTINEDGVANLSPFSFFNVFSANPPILIFSPARRVRDNTTKHTLENVQAIKEVVINIVNYPIVEQMSLTSTEYDKEVSEFKKAGLTPIKSLKVSPPRVQEAPVSFECVVDDIIALGKEGGAGNLIISRVVMIHMDNAYLDAHQKLDTKKLDLVARMGGSWYARANEQALFEIPKPIRTKGIGVDQLPKHIFKSNILSGNDLGRLGNTEEIPTVEELNLFKQQEEVKAILANSSTQNQIETLHQFVKELIEEDKIKDALKALFII